MKPVEKGAAQKVSSFCKCGVRMFDGECVKWCPRMDCPETQQRSPTEWQRTFYKLDEPFDPFNRGK